MNDMRNTFDNLDHSSDKWEPYFEIYERHLEKYRFKNNVTLIEIGVQKGGSLEMWSRWINCPNSKIIGVDIDPECAKLKYDQKNVTVHIADQKDMAFWDRIIEQNTNIDILIDDAGHYCDAQIQTFEKLFPVMPIGSVYICEDTHTSYMGYLQGGMSFIEYAKVCADVLHSNWITGYNPEYERLKSICTGLTSIHFYDSVVVFEKFGKKDMKRVFPTKFSNT